MWEGIIAFGLRAPARFRRLLSAKGPAETLFHPTDYEGGEPPLLFEDLLEQIPLLFRWQWPRHRHKRQ